ncbi:MAG TPA: heme biosynthesis HemY N-terminal domain-containing protein [Steroidobacteraceae bacterium]|nr:heme biosynthesis HemY N-terminal domain-containing protein [Steroidobacteraceae bacterium]
MKRKIYVVLALLVAALLAQFIFSDNGYVSVRIGGVLIETSLPGAMLVMIVLYFVVRGFIKMVRSPVLMRLAAENRKRERARRDLVQGLMDLSAGKWARAETTLTAHVHESSAPMVHYLAAARAAELLGSRSRCDEWLARALKADTENPAPALITQAELYLKRNQVQQALSILRDLQARDPRNERALELLARIYRQQGDWQQLQALTPMLRAITGAERGLIDEVEAQIALDRFKAIGLATDSKQLTTAWQELSSTLTTRPDVIVAYARAAIACRQFHVAEESLRKLLEEQWDEAAVLAYGEIEDAEPLDVLDRAEAWLPEHQLDANLLLTCARLAIRAELYGKARSYLETSLSTRPRLETYQIIASLAEQLGDRDRAYKVLNDAVVYAVGRKANIPKVRARRLERRQGNDRRSR